MDTRRLPSVRFGISDVVKSVDHMPALGRKGMVDIELWQMVLRAEDFLGSQSLEVRFEEMDEECSCESEKPAARNFQLSKGTGLGSLATTVVAYGMEQEQV
jgi:hypothetical protein